MNNQPLHTVELENDLAFSLHVSVNNQPKFCYDAAAVVVNLDA